MTEPKLEIDRRLDRIELAISTLANWLVQAQTGFNAKDVEGIERILRGEKTKNPLGPEAIAKAFHETYEELAPMYEWETQKVSAKAWDEIPEKNRKLMIAVVSDLLDKGIIQSE